MVRRQNNKIFTNMDDKQKKLEQLLKDKEKAEERLKAAEEKFKAEKENEEA